MNKCLNDKQSINNFDEEMYKWALESMAAIALDTRLGCIDMAQESVVTKNDYLGTTTSFALSAHHN